MNNQLIKSKTYIQTSEINYESSMATIRLLLETLEPDFNKDHINSLIEVISWNGCWITKKDSKFLSKLMKKTEKKIENYFYKKDIKEMKIYRKST